MQQAKGAHDTLIAAAHRAQADALVIEAEAKRRLADEYDAAQERGEVAKAGNPNSSASEELPGVADLGLTHKQVHEARQIRDAEEAQPGIIQQTVDRALADRREPTRAELQRSVLAAVSQCRKCRKGAARKSPIETQWRRLRGQAPPLLTGFCQFCQFCLVSKAGFGVRLGFAPQGTVRVVPPLSTTFPRAQGE